MNEKLKNVPIRKRVRILAIVAIVIMTILASVGLVTASVIGKVIIGVTYIIGAVTGVVATHWIATSILYQIQDVNDIMENVAEGNLDVKVKQENYTKEEFGTLFTCIHRTLEQLNTYVAYIEEVSQSLDKIADGYMKIDLSQDYTGEFAVLKTSLIKISDSLASTIRLINQSAKSVAGDSNALASSAHELSNGATDQASVIEELTASITSISELVSNNSVSAVKATEKVVDVKEAVNESDNDMKSLLDAMDNIRISSNKVVEIIATIQNIASQTNLLSLNASIESARAGESGRGFAVVATQIGQLATQSIQAAKDTADLIDETIQAVNMGTSIADTTAKSLQNVVDGTAEITTIMTEIANASKEQSEALSQITEGVEQIASVVDDNVTAAKVSSDASEKLKGEVQKLQEAVEKFKL